jgi:hypothetical protein
MHAGTLDKIPCGKWRTRDAGRPVADTVPFQGQYGMLHRVQLTYICEALFGAVHLPGKSLTSKAT